MCVASLNNEIRKEANPQIMYIAMKKYTKEVMQQLHQFHCTPTEISFPMIIPWRECLKISHNNHIGEDLSVWYLSMSRSIPFSPFWGYFYFLSSQPKLVQGSFHILPQCKELNEKRAEKSSSHPKFLYRKCVSLCFSVQENHLSLIPSSTRNTLISSDRSHFHSPTSAKM